MKIKLTLAFFAVLAALLLSSTFVAQEQPTRIVYMNSQEVVEAHPAGQEVRRLQEQANTELTPIRQDIEAMQARVRAGETLSLDERGQFDLWVQTYEAATESYAREIELASQPAIDAVNAAVAQIAIERGYAMVLDQGIAARSGLIVYADEALNITQQVIERIR
jgi:outer membrane protein